jgi:putative Mg2+ transporter-C (MgtC) family protein
MILELINMAEIASHIAQLGISFALALPIGWDREQQTRTAGLRTVTLVAVSTCGFLMAGRASFFSEDAESRVWQGLITGIGFIGSGAILKTDTSVHGTAIAASIWTTAAVGASVAYSNYDIAVMLSLLNFAVLRWLTPGSRGSVATPDNDTAGVKPELTKAEALPQGGVVTLRAWMTGSARALISQRRREQIRQLRWRLWDWWHGVETARHVDLGTLTIVGENRRHGVPYEPSGSMAAILRSIPIDHSQYGFIDFGSGKGRVLLEASRLPFRSVIGVEFSVELHRIAQQNLSKFRRARMRCRESRSMLCDAASFQPPAIPLVLYFFNPFEETVMLSVIENIRRSLRDHPRDIFVICAGRWTLKEMFERLPEVQTVRRETYNTVFRWTY